VLLAALVGAVLLGGLVRSDDARPSHASEVSSWAPKPVSKASAAGHAVPRPIVLVTTLTGAAILLAAWGLALSGDGTMRAARDERWYRRRGPPSTV
jgi:hypothetical protein